LSELDQLVRERPLLTRELHLVNSWYGHAEVLKRHAGWPDERPLKVTIEHGPWVDDVIWGFDVRSPLPIHLCAAPWRAKYFTDETGIEAQAIGPFIRYVQPENPPLPQRPLTVAFPAHSSEHIDAEYALDAFVANLERRAERHDVVVCVYWRDALRGLTAHFEERGFRCVTAGHINDPGFLSRLAGVIGSASHVFTNEVGTHVLYAALLGRPVWVASQPVDYVIKRQVAGHVDQDYDHPRLRRLRELFATEGDEVTEEQRGFVDDIIGSSATRSPDELRAIFDRAEVLYRDVAVRRRLRAVLLRGYRYRRAQLQQLRSRAPKSADGREAAPAPTR
jgi:hypothetical protein